MTKVTVRHFSLLEIRGENINHPKFQTMKKNISPADRIARLLLAVVIAVLYFTHQIEGTAAIVLGIAAIIIAATALISFCPLYRLFGISTRKKTAQL